MQAYEILSDPQKKAVYDEGGEQAIKEGGGRGGGGGGFSSPMDIFNMMFGGGMPGGGGRQSNKSKPMVHKLGVTLEELYNGKVAIIVCSGLPSPHRFASWRRRETSSAWLATGRVGATSAAARAARWPHKYCTGFALTLLQGRGMKIHMVQMGPGMVSQSQEICGECEGRGEVIPPSSRCKTCKGGKTVKLS